MQGFIKTLFGDRRTFIIAAISIIAAYAILHTQFAELAGLLLPVLLLCGANYLAKH